MEIFKPLFYLISKHVSLSKTKSKWRATNWTRKELYKHIAMDVALIIGRL